ncbi:phosphatase PAP2 family protein [Actinomadura keratinilytica]
MKARSAPAAEDRPDLASRPPLVRELLLVAGLFLVYKCGRLLAAGESATAFHHADGVWHAERALGLPDEGTVQSLLLHSDTLVRIANTYYATVHFPATALFLVWLYWRRPRHYLWSRRVLAVLTGAALVLHLLVPLAPPRMLEAAGLVDTGQVYGPTVYGAAPEADPLANQFAAMPSLHFGWALMVAVGLIAATRSRWRYLWLLHPALTLLVVVGTANHYWLDALAATGLLAAALATVRLAETAASRGHHLLGHAPLPGGGGERRPGRRGRRLPGLRPRLRRGSRGPGTPCRPYRGGRLPGPGPAGDRRCLVGRGRPQRRRGPAARGRAAVRPAHPGPAAGRAHPGRGGPTRRAVRGPPGGPARMARGAAHPRRSGPADVRGLRARPRGQPHPDRGTGGRRHDPAADRRARAPGPGPGAAPRHRLGDRLRHRLGADPDRDRRTGRAWRGGAAALQTALVALLVAAFATAGLLLAQTAYRSGLGAPLAVVTLANPLAASVVGLVLLGERLHGGAAGILPALAGALAAGAGVVALSRAAGRNAREPREPEAEAGPAGAPAPGAAAQPA